MEITTVRTELVNVEEQPFDPRKLKDRHEREKYYDREATKRILNTIAEIDMTSTETLNELNKQGEKIQKAQEDIAEVNDKISASKRVLRGISSVWSALGNKFRKRHTRRHRKKQQKWEIERQLKKQEKENIIEAEQQKDDKKKEEQVLIYDTPKFGIDDVDEYIEEQERDLELVLEGVKNIKEQAMVMNETLVDQNERLDKLVEDGERAYEKTKQIKNTVSRLV